MPLKWIALILIVAGAASPIIASNMDTPDVRGKWWDRFEVLLGLFGTCALFLGIGLMLVAIWIAI